MLQKSILIQIDQHIATVSLNKPDTHNAFDAGMLTELIDTFNFLEHEDTVRAVVLKGEGKSFCAGANLNWMLADFTNEKKILENATLMATCFYRIYTLPKPVVASVHGSVMGGGVGLMCVCDIILANDNARFALPEARIGLAPSTISPYVLNRLDASKAKWMMFTSEIIDTAKALEMNLIDFAGSSYAIDNQQETILIGILQASPAALKECKRLSNVISGRTISEQIIDESVQSFLSMRNSAACAEGLTSVQNKRKPSWVVDKQKTNS